MPDMIWMRGGNGLEWEVAPGSDAHTNLVVAGAVEIDGPSDVDGDGDVEGYEALLKKDLVELCVELGLDASGNKADLVGRLNEHDAAVAGDDEGSDSV